MKNQFKLVLRILIVLVILQNLALAARVEEVPLYGLYETTINYQALTGQSHSYAHPFYGVELEATFISPSGRRITWCGFYDGDGQGGQTGNIWKIRFMPDELGTWTFTWGFSGGSLTGSGSFQAVDNATKPRKPGPLRHDSDIHQWLITADGARHVFLNMYANPGHPNHPWELYNNPQDVLAEAKNYGFDVYFSPGGINPSYRDAPMTEKNPYPYMDRVDYIPRLRGWHVLERQYQAAYEQEMYLYEFAGFYGGNNFINLHQKPMSFQKKVIKYWLARTAPYYIFLYNVGFELQEYVSVPLWTLRRASWIKAIDPWDHLLTGHELRGWSYGYYSIMDYSTMQQYDYSNYHSHALAVWNSPSQPHPHMHEGLWTGPWGRPSSEQQSRKAQWDLITGGMSYAIVTIQDNVGLTSAKHANAFLESGVKWWTMAPHDEVVLEGTAYVLAKLGVEYIVYSLSGSNFTLDLPRGDYQWRWLNPADGTYSDWTLLNIPGEPVEFEKPDSNDWVVHIRGVPPDHPIPPSASQNLNATSAKESQIDVTWQASSDPEFDKYTQDRM